MRRLTLLIFVQKGPDQKSLENDPQMIHFSATKNAPYFWMLKAPITFLFKAVETPSTEKAVETPEIWALFGPFEIAHWLFWVQSSRRIFVTFESNPLSGKFDGDWTKVVIKGNVFTWRNGMEVQIIRQGSNSFTMTWQNEDFTATLRDDGKLQWGEDGEAWEKQGI